MSKQTNRFQQIVHGICQALGGTHYRVRESEFLDDACGKPNEVDIVIEDACANSTTRIVVECKDEKRPMTIDDFNSYVGRHNGKCALSADRIVMVTRNGYSERTVFRANEEGFELYTLTEEPNPNWKSPGRLKMTLREPIRLSAYQLHPLPSPPRPGPDAPLTCKKCGRNHGTLAEFLHREVMEVTLPSEPELLSKLVESAKSSPDNVAEETLAFKIDDLLVHHQNEAIAFDCVAVKVRALHGETEIRLTDYKLSKIDGESMYFRVWDGDFPKIGDYESFRLDMVTAADQFPRYSSGKITPAQRQVKKTPPRQNKPCPCRSGVKYKHCHGKKAK